MERPPKSADWWPRATRTAAISTLRREAAHLVVTAVLAAVSWWGRIQSCLSGKRTKLEGCPIRNTDQCGHLTVEEAAYNVLAVFFDYTRAASYFSGGITEANTPTSYQKGHAGSQPMNYLEVPYADVLYANKHQCVSNPRDVIGYMSVQQMLNQASHDLFGIADGTLPPSDSTPPVTTATLPAPTGLHGWYQGPTVVDFSATDDLSGVVKTEWSLDNQATWTPFACDPLRDDGAHNAQLAPDLAGRWKCRN